MDPADETATAARPGQLLAAERERQGLSRADIAQRLHMSASQVEALETGDYARLPRGTFLRGFVRNYAKAARASMPTSLLRSLADDRARATRGRASWCASQNIRFDPHRRAPLEPVREGCGHRHGGARDRLRGDVLVALRPARAARGRVAAKKAVVAEAPRPQHRCRAPVERAAHGRAALEAP